MRIINTSTCLTVESLLPLMMIRSSNWRQRTEPVCPLNCLSHWRSDLRQILIVVSRNPETIFSSSYCRQYTPKVGTYQKCIQSNYPCYSQIHNLSVPTSEHLRICKRDDWWTPTLPPIIFQIWDLIDNLWIETTVKFMLKLQRVLNLSNQILCFCLVVSVRQGY